eukprot:7187943-Lingulodinium_polyedra.AAC.1
MHGAQGGIQNAQFRTLSPCTNRTGATAERARHARLSAGCDTHRRNCSSCWRLRRHHPNKAN